MVATLGIGILYFGANVYKLARESDHKSDEDIDVLLVPGAALVDDGIQPVYQTRLDRAASLVRNGYAKKILLSGGCTPGNTVSEANRGATYLRNSGVRDDQIMLEEQSQHTMQNMVLASRMLGSDQESLIAICSSRTHLYRCQVFARFCGIRASLCAAETDLISGVGLWKRLLIEAAYVHWFYTRKVLGFSFS